MSSPGWPERLWFVRHAESLGNVANSEALLANALRLEIDVNDADTTLSETGVAQAKALGRWLAGRPGHERPTHLVVSPYARTRGTAQLIVDSGASHDLRVTVDERFRDREQGVLDRLTGAGVRDSYPDEAARRDYVGKFWYRPAGGESWADVALRVRTALLELRLTMPGERVMIVTHDVVILVARYILEQLSPAEATALSTQVQNCSLTTFRRAGDGMRLECFNDTSPRDDLIEGAES